MKQKGIAPILIVVLIAVLTVGGYLIYKLPRTVVAPQTPQTTPVPSPTPIPSPAPTSTGETANWKTYTNKEFKYELKYPSMWSLKDGPNFPPRIMSSIEIFPPGGNTLGDLSVIDIQVIMESWENTEKELKKTLETKEVKLNQISVFLTETAEKSGKVKVYTFPSVIKDQIIYIVYISSLSKPENSQILDQILSTFRFLP